MDILFVLDSQVILKDSLLFILIFFNLICFNEEKKYSRKIQLKSYAVVFSYYTNIN